MAEDREVYYLVISIMGNDYAITKRSFVPRSYRYTLPGGISRPLRITLKKSLAVSQASPLHF